MGHDGHCLQVVLFAERYDLKVPQDVLGDDARRLHRMDARLDRQAVSAANTSAIERWPINPFSCPAATRSAGLALRVVRMALLGSGNEDG